MKTVEMTVEQLRKMAANLGIKNAKMYKKTELAAKIDEILAKEESEETENDSEISVLNEENSSSEEVIENDSETVLEQKETNENDSEEVSRELKLPKGKQSIDIYNKIIENWGRKNFSLYRLTVTEGYSYTNIHRVWKLYIKPYDIKDLKPIKI